MFGAPCLNRTDDLLITSEAHCHCAKGACFYSATTSSTATAGATYPSLANLRLYLATSFFFETFWLSAQSCVMFNETILTTPALVYPGFLRCNDFAILFLIVGAAGRVRTYKCVD